MKKKKSTLEKNLSLIARTSFVVFLGIAVSKVLAYIYKVGIARYFGPEAYGLFSLAVNILSIGVALASLGLLEGIVQYVSVFRSKKSKEKVRYLSKFVLKVVLISGILVGIILYLSSDFISNNIFHNPDLAIFLKIFSFVIPLSVISDSFTSIIRSYEMIKWYTFLSYVWHNLIKVVFLFILIAFAFQREAIAWSYFAGILATLIVSFLVYRNIIMRNSKESNISDKEEKNIAKSMFVYSAPLLFSTVIGFIFVWIDSFSLGYLRGAVEVGLYNAAVPIAALLSIAPELFMKLFFPLVAKEYGKNNISLVRELSKQVNKWIFMLNLPILIFLTIFADSVINILFGEAYLSATISLRILLLSSFVSSITGIIPYKLIAISGRTKIVLLNIIIASTINLVLNYILIPMDHILFIDNTGGLAGASIATLISMCFSGILALISTRRYLSIIPLRRKMILLLIASIIALLPILYLQNAIESPISIFKIIGLFLIYSLFYFTILFLVKGFDMNDIKILRSVKNKLRSE